MCRFDPKNDLDQKNYFMVEGNVLELCEKATMQLGERSHSAIENSAEASSSIFPTLPGSPLAPSNSEDDDDLARRLYELRR